MSIRACFFRHEEIVILLQQLKQLCQSPNWKDIVHPYFYIDGLVFAVSAAPEIPMPDVWLPWVVKGQGQINTEDADQLTSLLLALLKSRLNEMKDEQFFLPKECTYSKEQTSSDPLQQWLTGLMYGHQKLEPVWQDAWKHMVEKTPEDQPILQRDLSHCLRMFSTFAHPDLAIEQAMQRGNEELADKLPAIFNSFPKALKQYVDISGKLVGFMPNQFEMYKEPVEKPEAK